MSGLESFSGLHLSKRAAFAHIVCLHALAPLALKINNELSGGKYFFILMLRAAFQNVGSLG